MWPLRELVVQQEMRLDKNVILSLWASWENESEMAAHLGELGTIRTTNVLEAWFSIPGSTLRAVSVLSSVLCPQFCPIQVAAHQSRGHFLTQQKRESRSTARCATAQTWHLAHAPAICFLCPRPQHPATPLFLLLMDHPEVTLWLTFCVASTSKPLKWTSEKKERYIKRIQGISEKPGEELIWILS